MPKAAPFSGGPGGCESRNKGNGGNVINPPFSARTIERERNENLDGKTQERVRARASACDGGVRAGSGSGGRGILNEDVFFSLTEFGGQ